MKFDMIRMVWHNLFQKPATMTKREENPNLRGLLVYNPQTCVACGLCMKDCPTGAIQIVNKGTKEAREMHAYLDTGRCIFCGQCADSCSQHSLHLSPKTELTQTTHEALVIEL